MLKRFIRWLRPLFWAPGATSQAHTAGRVQQTLIEVPEDCYVNVLNWVNGSAVSGNVRAGIVGPLVTPDTSDQAPVAYDSGDIVQSGTNTAQKITFTEVFLRRGQYYLQLTADNATATFMRQGNTTQAVGWSQFYDRAGGYGAFTNPSPTPTNSGSNCPTMMMGVSRLA